ncbi:hypothetical protein C0J52_26792 [Blattella germanica]|nr:hypothetical protein C0J52_26792 [Blattella germanica]
MSEVQIVLKNIKLQFFERKEERFIPILVRSMLKELQEDGDVRDISCFKEQLYHSILHALNI